VPAAARALVGPVWAELCAADPGLAALANDPAPVADPRPDDPAPVADPRADDPASVADAPPDVSAQVAARPPDDPVPAANPRPADSAAATAPPPDEASPVAHPSPGSRLTGRPEDGAGPLLDAYFALEDPRRLEPEARELLVEAELESGLLLRGYVDRVDTVDPGSADGVDTGSGPVPGVRVVDYKTGSAPGPGFEARALFQLKFYALALLRLRGRAPDELRLLYLTGPEALSYIPDEEQLHRFGRMLDALWAAIRAAAATGDFRPNPGRACSWCSHRHLCPAWDGVPPPYPGMPADAGADAGTDDTDRAGTPFAAVTRP
jgi:RecB family exonuclease